ncbi:uncharacterized protein LOC109831359 [Asparagus officinalis]|uniref:uncharacterized protein LOC109831359 n=1 Tax=Asparagus officinalis TaxID=4686 RepID=UPI00098DEBC4|nr:uncharacterized protein LOC109831359 [Asparagus officinalis]
MALAGRALATHDAVLDAAREIESVHKEPEDSHVIQSRTPAATSEAAAAGPAETAALSASAIPSESPLSAPWSADSWPAFGENINTGNGVLVASSGYESCPVVICGRELFADFLVINLPSFDVVFRMDWLGSFFATINCRRRSVVFEIPDHPRFEFTSGSISARPVEFRARPKKSTLAAMQVESEKPVVVREFEDIFPDDIYGLPPD